MLIEKPLGDRHEGVRARILAAIESAKLDAVVGYTSRFRARWLAAKGKKCPHRCFGRVPMVTRAPS